MNYAGLDKDVIVTVTDLYMKILLYIYANNTNSNLKQN